MIVTRSRPTTGVNRETHPNLSSPQVHAVLKDVERNKDQSPDFTDTFNRVRPVENVLNPRRMVGGLLNALHSPGADRRAIVAEVARELPHEIGIRRRRLPDGFRSTKPSPPRIRAGPWVRRRSSPATGRPPPGLPGQELDVVTSNTCCRIVYAAVAREHPIMRALEIETDRHPDLGVALRRDFAAERKEVLVGLLRRAANQGLPRAPSDLGADSPLGPR
ncbi:hypothetical protein [Mycolicibacterium septicum]|uniref:hypothetical protein n=1 Tax=Mycolicibacterium septicum TaxID=98668 RepID=UPI002360A934|nr:hypothetical protein [Mycolicibacterium septicum]